MKTLLMITALVFKFMIITLNALNVESISKDDTHSLNIWLNSKKQHFSNSKYLEGRLQKSDKRFSTMLTALNLLSMRNAKVLVETGTARFGDKNFVGDGGSTVVFGDWASNNQAMLYSVDIDPEAVIQALNATKDFESNREVICSDSIGFLESFQAPIDFLYLDSFDFDFTDPFPSQKHHLQEIIAAYPKLHSNSIVMIDDCDLPHGGKGVLVIKFLLAHGWKVLKSDYQVILIP